MQISSRFTIAIHIMACLDVFKNDYKTTSDFIASSVSVNPVVIRRIMRQLKSAGLITVARGSGGANIARPLNEITLLDVYNAVECVESGGLFRFHENPNVQCPVGRNIHSALDERLCRVQAAMENEMKKTTLADVIGDVKVLISREDK